jgi:hypothetical protein
MAATASTSAFLANGAIWLVIGALLTFFGYLR